MATSISSHDNDDIPQPALRGRGRGAGRRGGRGRGRGVAGDRSQSSYVPSEDLTGGPVRGAPRPRSNYSPAPAERRALPIPRGGGSTPENARAKTPTTFNRRSGDSDNPTIPPRSPPITPKKSNLPPLPARNLTSTNDAANVTLNEEQQRRRNQCIQEIYQTEKDYINDLETMINVFIFPLRTMSVLDEQKEKQIFSNVEVLLGCNMEMLNGLESVMSGNSSITIGDVFTQLAEYFKMYKVYCANQQTSITTVDMLMKKNQQFKRNLEVCHSDPRCKGLFLQSFLIKPIQRVCKYPLLLREMIRHTPEGHPDYQTLENAFSKINAVVSDINEAQRQAEGLQRIMDLTDLIDGVDSLVAPGRKFVKEGELTFYKSPKSKNGEKRTVFFFTDLILLTTKKNDKKYEHKLSVPIDSCKLIVIADSNHLKNAFELQQKQLQKKCILAGENQQESGLWIKEIRALIKGYQKKQLLMSKC